MLYEFSGEVIEVCENSFWASLQDLTQPCLPVEVAEIKCEALDSKDRGKLQCGDVFIWRIDGEGNSKIIFHRNKRLSQKTLQSIKRKAAKIFKSFGDNNG